MTTILLDDADTESEAWDIALELGKVMLQYLFLTPDEWVILPPRRIALTKGQTGKPWQVLAQRKGSKDEATDLSDGANAA